MKTQSTARIMAATPMLIVCIVLALGAACWWQSQWFSAKQSDVEETKIES